MANKEKTYSKEDVVKAWSDLGGQQDRYDVREVDTLENGKVTQLIDNVTGSLVVQVNKTGKDAYSELVEKVGQPVIDAGDNPREQVEGDENLRTSKGNVAFPTQPSAIDAPAEPVEINPAELNASADSGKK